MKSKFLLMKSKKGKKFYYGKVRHPGGYLSPWGRLSSEYGETLPQDSNLVKIVSLPYTQNNIAPYSYLKNTRKSVNYHRI